ncbi:MAG: carboxypeptidase M32 [Euryarchaeota archaeon]|nr:carboxypeptidase M32 [Euryarchaeota archaeon]
MDRGLQDLRARLAEITDLNHAASVLSWDQMTYMPPGGAEARARQTAMLQRLAHEKATDPALGRLLDSLRPLENKLGYDSDDASLIRVARRNYDIVTKVPIEFAARMFLLQAESYEAWARARPKNDFKGVYPYLEKVMAYSREYSEFFPGYGHVMDPLISNFDYGVKARTIRKVFRELRAELVPLVRKIRDAEQVDDSCLHGKFPTDLQAKFNRLVAERMGYDFQRGRIDETPHPFTTNFSIGDVRITTRYHEDYLGAALFSTIHETGHALYEQGPDPALEGLLGTGAGMGIHESQSRLWENQVGRSMEFWKYFYPALRKAFPEKYKGVRLPDFYRAINRVEPSLIRVAADEVTYNLHIMIRFDLECALMEGKLSVKELPEAWNDRYLSDLGVSSKTYADGVMQDVHWFSAYIGYFQSYALGNLLSAQLYDAALKAKPAIRSEIATGKFSTLLGWLRKNVHRHGLKFTTDELLERCGVGGIEVGPFMDYLRKKYKGVYGL